jgi:hypothetical protein
MPSTEHKSTQIRIPLVLGAALLTVLAVIAIRPAAGLAAPGDPPQLSFAPGSHDFGLQPIYESAHASFEVRNDGAEGAQVDSLGTSGPDSGNFWVGNSNCWGTWLEPGQTCSVEVNFNPNDIREYGALLQAHSGPHQFTAGLTGSGGSSFFTSTPNPVDFGAAKVDGEGSTRQIEVTNAGNLPGGVFIAVISGGAVGSYQLLDENCTNRMIAPAESCTAQVRFRPTSEGVKKATLSLFGDGDGGAQVTLTGAAPDPASQPNPPPSAGVAAAGGVTVILPAAGQDRSELRMLKQERRIQHVQRRLRELRRQHVQRRLRTLRRQRALRRHGRIVRAAVRPRMAIGG